MDSAEMWLVMFCCLLFPFDIAKSWHFQGNQKEFPKAGYRIRWHNDCAMSRQETIGVKRQYPEAYLVIRARLARKAGRVG